MQNRYVGNVGDFGKYGLLRSLGANLKLGVVWYFVPDASPVIDGKSFAYLKPSPENLSRFRKCDPDLYDKLARIVNHGERSVQRVRQRGVLPAGTCFFEDELTFERMASIGPRAKEERLDCRKCWVERAVISTQDADIVLLDPNIGIESGTQRHEIEGPNYVYFDDIQPYLCREQSVVVYHHLARKESAEMQIERRLDQLQDQLHGHSQISALRYRRGSPTVFFVIPAPAHNAELEARIHCFVQGPWSQNFDLVRSQDGITTDS